MSTQMGWQVAHSFRSDRSVLERRIAKGTWPRIWEFASGYRRLIYSFLALVLLDALLGSALPLIYKAIIDDGVDGRDRGLIIGLALLVAGLAFAEGALSLISRWFSARIGEGLIYDMRARVFSHIQRQPIAFFTRTQTGALISRLNNDVIGAQAAFTGTLSSVVSNLLTVVLTLVIMLQLSWQVTVISLILVPLFIVPARLLGGRMRKLTREGYAIDAGMNTQMTERFNVSGAMLVHLFGRPADEERDFRERAARVRDIGVTQAMFSRIFFVALSLIASLGLAISYGIGGVLAYDGTIKIGTLVALTAYLQRLYGPLTALSNVRVDVLTALVSFERVFEVLDLEPMIRDADDAVTLPPGAPASVVLDHATFSYPTAAEVSLASLESVAILDSRASGVVLRDVSFEVHPGELVAIVGPSGAGKTTISSLVSRLYDVTGGSVMVGGVDVRSLTAASLHSEVGVVTQDAHLFHDTIRANLVYARPEATEADLWEALDAAQVGTLVRSLGDGLDTLVGERGHRLSGGEKQRIALARLLLKGPRIVVLDEATAHLDSESELAVQRALDAALVGRTSIVIAHRLSTIVAADQILVLAEGQIVERGTHLDLLARGGLYAELFHTQFETQLMPSETSPSVV
jgi:ATP-binding cassette subfamily B protein